MKTPFTWSTWDVRCINAVMKLPELAEVRIAVYDNQKRTLHDELRWESLHRLGGHTPEGDYFHVTLKYREAVFALEFAARQDEFVYKITPVTPQPYLRFFVSGLFRWNAPGSVKRFSPNGFKLIPCTVPHPGFSITVEGEPDHTPVNTTLQGILVGGQQVVYIRCNHEMTQQEMEAFIAFKRAAWEEHEMRGGGWLQDTPQAITRGIMWNTIYEPIRDRICTPVTREWCIVKPERPWFGSYVLFVWDTCFNALIAAGQNKALAEQQIYSLLQGMVNGMVPMVDSEVSVFADRSQPPVGAFVALKLYHQFGDAAFLAKIFERLLSWHRWWLPNRDRNGDGLLEWGTDLPVTHTDYQGYLEVCKAESGLDNSPMYDETSYDPDLHTMRLSDVGLTCLYTLDAWALAEIAAILRKENLLPEALAELEGELRAEYAAFGERINREMWNEELGIYCNKHWDGRFSEILGVTCFYPMLAGIAPQERAERMVRDHLLNPDEFWGEFAIAASPRNHPTFADNDYWRGRIWAPTNFLVYEGLKRGGFDDAARELAEKSLRLFLQEWQNESHIHENYNTLTGDGDDVYNADPVYTWGGLLGLIGMSELVHVRMDGGIDFRCPQNLPVSLHNYHVGKFVYDIEATCSGLNICRSDALRIETNVPAVISRFHQRVETISFEIGTAGKSGTLCVTIPPGVRKLSLRVNGRSVEKLLQEQVQVVLPL